MRVKNIHVVRSKGHEYYYHRHTRKRITAEPGSAEFFVQVSREDAKVQNRGIAKGSLRHLQRQYRSSAEFTTLAPRTRRDYDRVMEWLLKEADQPVSDIKTPNVVKLRDKAFEQHGRSFANYVVAVTSILFNWGRAYGFASANPAEPVKKIKRPKDAARANRPWSKAERLAVLQAAPSQLVLPIALAMFTGLRQSDVIALAWNSYDGFSIETKQKKTGDRVWLPVQGPLKTILDSAPRVSTIICVNSKGRPWTQDGLRTTFHKLIRSLETKGLVDPGLTFHGLRHSLATDIAEQGGGDKEIAAILGHRTNAMASRYSRDADRKRLAQSAINRLANSKIDKTSQS